MISTRSVGMVFAPKSNPLPCCVHGIWKTLCESYDDIQLFCNILHDDINSFQNWTERQSQYFNVNIGSVGMFSVESL